MQTNTQPQNASQTNTNNRTPKRARVDWVRGAQRGTRACIVSDAKGQPVLLVQDGDAKARVTLHAGSALKLAEQALHNGRVAAVPGKHQSAPQAPIAQEAA